MRKLISFWSDGSTVGRDIRSRQDRRNRFVGDLLVNLVFKKLNLGYHIVNSCIRKSRVEGIYLGIGSGPLEH